nr:unnamed protein product [Digitaria exilis]
MTTITVAHRLSKIQGADMIAVLKDGMIVEKGTHEALMGIDGGVGDMAAEESTATAAADAGKPGKGSEEEREKGTATTTDKVPFHGLFMYADRTDAVLMLAGMVGAVGNGMSMVVITVIFGQMVNAFGAATPGNILHRVSKEALNFIYLAIGTGFASFVQTTTGQVVSSISADTTLIQGAIGEKIGRFLQLVTTFFGGFVLAFIKGWLLTLVMLSTIPPFVAAAGIVAKVLSKISNQGLASYSDAGDVVEQTIGSIRTVVSFNGEKKAIELYNDLIKKAYKGAVKAGAAHGFGMGLLALIYFSTFGLIIWYGSKLSLTKGYSRGDILNVMFAIMIGARLDWIRGKIGLVNQEPLLFMTSIRENINYGKEDATFEEIKRAAELANAASFIENFPNGYAQVKFLQGFSQDAKTVYEEASQVATEAVGSIRTVASFCAEKRVMDKYNQKCQASRDQGIRTGIVGGLGFGFSYLMLYASSALCYYVGAKFVSQGKSTFGDVFKAYFALLLAMLGVSQTNAMASDSAKANDSATSIFSILDRKSQIDSSSEEGSTLANVKGDIDFKHVSFKYPSRPDVQIFTDFTLDIPSGKTVALVGQSGSGKSTVIALLERFYEPDSGAILLDKVEIGSLKISWLREQMGLVSQEPVLFSGTIRDNIAYGKHEEVTEEEIAAAARAANAHEFISSMPQGYNTAVGERGAKLSGGQKQRIAIARAILKDPRILLLDEATSALDAESERVVQDALDRVMVGRTTITVAHRISTIQGADMIAVLKDGVIVEKGRHETLIGVSGGAYASLVELRTM